MLSSFDYRSWLLLKMVLVETNWLSALASAGTSCREGSGAGVNLNVHKKSIESFPNPGQGPFKFHKTEYHPLEI